jgi:hypothetical protein
MKDPKTVGWSKIGYKPTLYINKFIEKEVEPYHLETFAQSVHYENSPPADRKVNHDWEFLKLREPHYIKRSIRAILAVVWGDTDPSKHQEDLLDLIHPGPVGLGNVQVFVLIDWETWQSEDRQHISLEKGWVPRAFAMRCWGDRANSIIYRAALEQEELRKTRVAGISAGL